MRDRFQVAAHAYRIYGVIYLIGGSYLILHGVGVRGGRVVESAAVWVVLGLFFIVFIPYVLAQRRAWFERWIVSRRDFARILVVFMAWRAWHVLRVVIRPDTATVAAPWGGEITFRLGAAVFLVVTVATFLVIGRAAWAEETA